MSKAQEKKAARAKLAREQRESDFRAWLLTPHGKRLFWGFLDLTCGVFGGSYVEGAPDLVAFKEGRRSVGIELMQEAQRIAPESYAAMVLERIQDANTQAALRAAENAVPATGEASDR